VFTLNTSYIKNTMKIQIAQSINQEAYNLQILDWYNKRKKAFQHDFFYLSEPSVFKGKFITTKINASEIKN